MTDQRKAKTRIDDRPMGAWFATPEGLHVPDVVRPAASMANVPRPVAVARAISGRKWLGTAGRLLRDVTLALAILTSIPLVSLSTIGRSRWQAEFQYQYGNT